METTATADGAELLIILRGNENLYIEVDAETHKATAKALSIFNLRLDSQNANKKKLSENKAQRPEKFDEKS
jgi:hypothetical protein